MIATPFTFVDQLLSSPLLINWLLPSPLLIDCLLHSPRRSLSLSGKTSFTLSSGSVDDWKWRGLCDVSLWVSEWSGGWVKTGEGWVCDVSLWVSEWRVRLERLLNYAFQAMKIEMCIEAISFPKSISLTTKQKDYYCSYSWCLHINIENPLSKYNLVNLCSH